MAGLLGYFAITFTLTWTFWFHAARLSGGGLAPAGSMRSVLATVLLYLGTFTPGLMALVFTRRSEGPAGVRALLARLFQWNVGARWYVFALAYMFAIKLGAALIHRIALGAWPRFGTEPVLLMFAATFFSLVVGGQSGEEVGWRGYALPRMAERLGLGGASVVLGVIWAVWHLPLFYLLPAADTYHQSFPVYALGVVSISVAMAWLYAHTRGSLLLTMLFHAAINNTKDIVPAAASPPPGVWALSPSRVGWIALALMWVAAGYFLVRMPKVIGRESGARLEPVRPPASP